MRPWIGAADEHGRALVLVHGAGGDHKVWNEVFGLLRRAGVPVVAVDLPGHGRNPDPAPATVAERADAVLATLASAGVRDYAVAGHSLGGAIALTLAVRPQAHGEPVLRGLGAVSTGARLPVDPKVLDFPPEAFQTLVAGLARFVFAKGAPPERIAEAAAMLEECGPATFRSDFAACAAYGVDLDDLRRVAVPAEVVCGDADVLTPFALSEELAAALPGAHLTKLPNVGHLPLLEDPAGLAVALERLWGRAFP